MSGTAAGITSGTVLQVSYPQRKVLDHAFRKAGYDPQKVTSEWIEIAQDLLFTQLAEYVSAGFPLWTRQQVPLPIAIGSPNVPMPYGTVDALHVYWRIFNPWRGAATDSNGVSVSALFAGQANSDITIAGPTPGVIVSFGTSMEVDTVGILPGFTTGYLIDGYGNPILDGYGNPILSSPSSYSAALEVMTSTDGITFTNVKTLPTTTFQGGVWSYFDLEPSISAPFVKIMYPITGNWTLNQVNLCLANGTSIQIGPQNIDDFYNLPNRSFRGGQPNTSYVDRQLDAPVIKIWPTPNDQAFYNGTVAALIRRYIQDPGQMTNSLEIPARWLEGVTSRLAIRLMDELPYDAPDPQAAQGAAAAREARYTRMEAAATKAESIMWGEERVRAPIRILPNLSAYTR